MEDSKKVAENDLGNVPSTGNGDINKLSRNCPYHEETDPIVAEIQGKILDTQKKLEFFLKEHPVLIPAFMQLDKIRDAFRVPSYLQILEDGTVVDVRGVSN
jgi:hypothetical protein